MKKLLLLSGTPVKRGVRHISSHLNKLNHSKGFWAFRFLNRRPNLLQQSDLFVGRYLKNAPIMKDQVQYSAIKMLLAFFMFSTSFAIGQETFSNQWTLYKEVNGVQIYTKLESCDRHTRDEQMVFVKLVNTNEVMAAVHFHLDQFYDGVCKTCDDSHGEYSADIEVQAGQTIEGSCSNTTKGLGAFAGWVDSQEPLMLTKLELSEIDIRLDIKDDRHVISQEEFDAMPTEKKQHILDNPDLYVIK